MTHYRVYKLRDPQGPIVKGKDMLASNDEEAMRNVEADEDCPICEIWSGARKVGSID